MPDARALREIVDVLRVLKDKADRAGSPTVWAMLMMTTEGVRREAEAAARLEERATRPAAIMQRLGDP